jgi:hypothetical protein
MTDKDEGAALGFSFEGRVKASVHPVFLLPLPLWERGREIRGEERNKEDVRTLKRSV